MDSLEKLNEKSVEIIKKYENKINSILFEMINEFDEEDGIRPSYTAFLYIFSEMILSFMIVFAETIKGDVREHIKLFLKALSDSIYANLGIREGDLNAEELCEMMEKNEDKL